MLLATSAFGAVSITVDQVSQTPVADISNPALGAKVSFTFHLNITGSEMVESYSIAAADVTTGARALLRTYSGNTGSSATNAQNAAAAQTRTELTEGTINDPAISNAGLVGTVTPWVANTSKIPGKALADLGDLGFNTSDATTPAYLTAGGPLVTYNFWLPAGVPTSDIKIRFNCSTTLFTGEYSDGIPLTADGPAVATVVTLTPEPASMLLLAAGAAFFARRRRA